MLPVGSFEQHDIYLPLSTDTVIAVTTSSELAADYPIMQLPPITLSCSHEHSAWPGTTSISAATLFSVVNDVAPGCSCDRWARLRARTSSQDAVGPAVASRPGLILRGA